MNDEAKLDAQMPNSVLSHINLDGKNRKWLRHAGNGNQLRGQAVVSARRGVQGCPARASRMAFMGGTALSLMVIR